MYEKGPYTVIANWDQSFSRDGGSGLVYCFHFPQQYLKRRFKYLSCINKDY